MSENLLIPLPGFTLPADFPWRVRFIVAVDQRLRRLRATGHFVPSRFFGYYLQGDSPMGVSGSWTVALKAEAPWRELNAELDRLTDGRFSIASNGQDREPDFMLVHDRMDGACWLWRFAYAMKFVGATEPIIGGGGAGGDAANDRTVLGP